MVLKEDLNRHIKQSKPKFYIGVAIVIFSVVCGVILYSETGDLFKILNQGVFLLVGINCIIDSRYPFVFGKRFIDVDENLLRIQTVNIYEAYWDDIEYLEFRKIYLGVKCKNTTLRLIETANLTDEMSMKIVSVLKSIAEAKGIEVSDK